MNRRSFITSLLFVPFVAKPIIKSIINNHVPLPHNKEFPNSYYNGYKGNEFLSTGFVYAPYIPLYITNKIL